MANGKKSFVFYCEWIETFTELTDNEAGKLIKHVLSYVNDENPDTDDRLIKLSFIPIKQTLKRDLKKYKTYVEKQKANGKKGGRPKTQITQAFIEKPKKADNVNVNDNSNTIIEVDFLKIDSFIKQLKNEATYLEGLYRLHKLKAGSLSNIAEMFKNHLKIHPKIHTGFSDFKKHFAHWVSMQVSNNKLNEYLRQRIGSL